VGGVMGWCPTCGRQAVEGDLFCRRCGRSLAPTEGASEPAAIDRATSDQASEQETAASPSDTRAKSRAKSRRVTWIAVILIAVVASLAAVIMLTRGSDAGESTKAQATEAPERIKLVVSAEGFPASLEMAAATVRENGTIYIPAGTYALDASVTLSKSVHLLGDGQVRQKSRARSQRPG
jgi:hypothetical protein